MNEAGHGTLNTQPAKPDRCAYVPNHHITVQKIHLAVWNIQIKIHCVLLYLYEIEDTMSACLGSKTTQRKVKS